MAEHDHRHGVMLPVDPPVYRYPDCPACGDELEGEIIPPGERREEIPYPDTPGPPPPPPAGPRTRPAIARGKLPGGPEL